MCAISLVETTECKHRCSKSPSLAIPPPSDAVAVVAINKAEESPGVTKSVVVGTPPTNNVHHSPVKKTKKGKGKTDKDVSGKSAQLGQRHEIPEPIRRVKVTIPPARVKIPKNVRFAIDKIPTVPIPSPEPTTSDDSYTDEPTSSRGYSDHPPVQYWRPSSPRVNFQSASPAIARMEGKKKSPENSTGKAEASHQKPHAVAGKDEPNQVSTNGSFKYISGPEWQYESDPESDTASAIDCNGIEDPRTILPGRHVGPGGNDRTNVVFDHEDFRKWLEKFQQAPIDSSSGSSDNDDDGDDRRRPMFINKPKSRKSVKVDKGPSSGLKDGTKPKNIPNSIQDPIGSVSETAGAAAAQPDTLTDPTGAKYPKKQSTEQHATETSPYKPPSVVDEAEEAVQFNPGLNIFFRDV